MYRLLNQVYRFEQINVKPVYITLNYMYTCLLYMAFGVNMA